MAKNKKNSVKKALLKNILARKDGSSSIKMDGGLGKTPLSPKDIGSGGGSNLGTNGIF